MKNMRKILLVILLTCSSVLGADMITGHPEVKSLLRRIKSSGAETYSAPIIIMGLDNLSLKAVVMFVRRQDRGIEWEAMYLAGQNDGPNMLVLSVPDGISDRKLKDFLNSK